MAAISSTISVCFAVFCVVVFFWLIATTPIIILWDTALSIRFPPSVSVLSFFHTLSQSPDTSSSTAKATAPAQACASCIGSKPAPVVCGLGLGRLWPVLFGFCPMETAWQEHGRDVWHPRACPTVPPAAPSRISLSSLSLTVGRILMKSVSHDRRFPSPPLFPCIEHGMRT